MKLLLDTHVLLWSAGDPDRLAADVRAKIEAQGNVRLISAASIWEIATKHALGKLPLREPAETFCRRALIDLCGDELAISARHALVAASLPNHHRDPFDRILIAQAIVEGATLITADHAISAYQVPLLWATTR